MTGRQPQDHAARQRALEPDCSFIVQAPAGSGKTELLTQRFLRLLGVVERPEEIVAITFTRKAAGEMRHRILEALQLGAMPEAPAEPHRRQTWTLAQAALRRDRALGWRLLESPRRLRVETIDALNAWLARQLPLGSRLGAAPGVAEDPEPVYRDSAREVLLAADSDAPHARHARALLAHLGGRFGMAESLLVALLKGRDHWLGKIIGRHAADEGAQRALLDQALRHFVEDELARCRAALPASTLDEIVRLGATAARRAPELERLAPLAGLAESPRADARDLPAWRALASLLLTGQGEWRRTVNKNQGFPPQERADKAEFVALLDLLGASAEATALARVRDLPEPAYDEARWQILAHLLAMLPICAATLELNFAARGESDYVGIARAALDALGTAEAPTDFALALDARISHLLVDEFQDTSQAQIELLERLTAGWTPGDGRSLFCVGDPMQSIYRFREADVGRFLRAQQSGIGGLPLETLRLSVNFRSQAGLVEWVSTLFPGIFPQAPDLSLGAVPFAPSEPWHEAEPGPAVHCHAAAPPDAQGEAQAVADCVQLIRRDSPTASIAVLVRSRSHLACITPALRAAGVPVRAVEIERLAGVPAIRDLEALTRALCHRADRTAWLGVLRAPWCGLSLADLLQVAGDETDDIWQRLQSAAVREALSEDGRARVARACAALAPALAERGRRPLRRVVTGAWLALGGAATLERSSELDDARSFVEFIDRHARHGELADPPALSTLLGELYAAPAATGEEAVQLLTIHKAKGLEFDHVILPGLDRTSGWNEKRLLRWLEQVRPTGPELILAPLERFGDEPDALHRALRGLDARRDELELDRLLYVAVTRARSRLHLFARVPPDPAPDEAPPAPRNGTLLARLWPALGTEFLGSRVPAELAATDLARPRARVSRLPLDWAPPPMPAVLAWRGDEVDSGEANAPLEFDWSGHEARAVGSAVHRLLQVIARDGAEAWPEARLRAAEPRVATLLHEAGLAPPRQAAALQRAMTALACTLADARGRWLLDPRHVAAASERRISGRLDGHLVDGVVDRCFVTADGTLWIVDYKTGWHGGGELDAFLDREQQRYRPQLERYARLLRSGHAGPIRLGLYFPQHAGWREWAPAPE